MENSTLCSRSCCRQLQHQEALEHYQSGGLSMRSGHQPALQSTLAQLLAILQGRQPGAQARGQTSEGTELPTG